ncbi:MAG: c-type cytochrome domain-containing protein [Gemmataceae bacterium]
MTRLLLPLVAAYLAGLAPVAGADFDRDVAPLLARRCLDCHSGPAPKGRLDLSRQKAARGVLTGKLDDVALWQRVRDDEMPPKKPLPDAEKAILRRWVESGAKWGADPIDPFRVSTEHRAGYDWWSLRPVAQRTVPLEPAG